MWGMQLLQAISYEHLMNILVDLKVKLYAEVPAVLKFLKLQICFEIVLKSQSFSTNVLILTIVVCALPSDSLMFYLQHCLSVYLFTSYVDPVLTFVSLRDCDNHGFLCNTALVVVVSPFRCL